MGETTRRKSPPPESAVEREVRDQEVLRAKRELAAYFKGLRTEREARAALKTIKAFVRARERQDSRSRPPLPGVRESKRSRSTGRPKSVRRRPRSQTATTEADASPSTSEPVND